jgi:hypothetical protein
MIETCSRFTIEDLLHRVTRSPRRFRAVTVVSPFIDDVGTALLVALDEAPCEFAVRLLTRPETAAALNQRVWLRTLVFGVDGVHAKLYAALGISSCQHEAVITSANLTAAGLRSNIEMGIRVTGSDGCHAAFVEQAAKWSMNITRAIRMSGALTRENESCS